jgi:hypothetical protein
LDIISCTRQECPGFLRPIFAICEEAHRLGYKTAAHTGRLYEHPVVKRKAVVDEQLDKFL